MPAGCKIFTVIGSLLVDHTFGGGLPALIVISRVVVLAIQAYVQRAVARRTGGAKLDPFARIDPRPAMPALHDRPRFCCFKPLDSITVGSGGGEYVEGNRGIHWQFE